MEKTKIQPKDYLRAISALNDETRVLILRFLQEYGESCVCDLELSLGMLQSRLSRHLKILMEAGYLEKERKGVWSHYYIVPQDWFREKALENIKMVDVKIPPQQKACPS